MRRCSVRRAVLIGCDSWAALITTSRSTRVGIPLGERERDHAAVRRADDRVTRSMPIARSTAARQSRLIVRGDDARGRPVGIAAAVEEVDAKDAKARVSIACPSPAMSSHQPGVA